MERKPISVTVDAIIYNTMRILLVRRKHQPFQDYWAMPGGFVEYGESVYAALKREIKEETNIDLEKAWYFGCYSKPDRDPRGHVISNVFLCPMKVVPLTAKAGDDAKELDLHLIEGLSGVDLAFDHMTILNDFRRFLKCPREFVEEKFPIWFDVEHNNTI